VQMDGPLANGPKGDPTDSDITRFGWDALGHQLVSVNLPGGQIDQLSHEENSTRLSQITSTWGSQRTRKWNRYDPQGNVEAAGEDLLNEKLEVLSSRQVNQTRDAWNRISSVAWDSNQVASIAYGADGQRNTLSLGKDQSMRLVPATDLAQNAGFLLPGLRALYGLPGSRSAAQIVQFDANDKTAKRQFDDFGRVVAIQNPAQGWQLAQYDDADQLQPRRNRDLGVGWPS
jgi:hypothetical protein